MIEIIGFFFSSILGTIGHFLYKLSNNNKLIGFFFSKDESIYSHLKLGFTPILLFMIIESFYYKNPYICSIKGISMAIFAITIIFIYKLSNIILKKDIPAHNISLFYFALLLSYTISFILFNMVDLPKILILIGIILFITILLSYLYQLKPR